MAYLRIDAIRTTILPDVDGYSEFGIACEAVCSVIGTRQTIRSPMLWGIGPDDDPRTIADAADNRLQYLRDILVGLGFDANDPKLAAVPTIPPWGIEGLDMGN